jgi:DNA repair exonuclease SbcCD ATPase subunit
MTKSTMDGQAKQRLVHSEPIDASPDPLEKLYDLMGRVLAKALDEFDDKLAERDAKIANLQARIAEREDKRSANVQKLQADLVKQIKRLTARLSEQERRHKREIEELRAKAAPTIIAWKTDKHHFRLTPFMSDGRPGPAAPLHGLFQSYHEQVNG